MEKDIPKIIHYCWFGGNPLPEEAKKCIESWQRCFPGYIIKEWNENNFDLTSCDYVKEAYRSKKWAFVSDYARFKIIYENGGLYFDTDVEALKSFDDILEHGGFMGQEDGIALTTLNNKEELNKPCFVVNPGLGIAAKAGLSIYKELIDYYHTLHFIKNGVMDTTTICTHTTNILKKHGYNENISSIQKIQGVTIYPPEYFCPQNCDTGELNITNNTHSIHHYSASWHSFLEKIIIRIERCNNRTGMEYRYRRLVSLPFRVINKIYKIMGSIIRAHT